MRLVYQYGKIEVIYYPVGVLIRVYANDSAYLRSGLTWRCDSMEGDAE